jgi:peptide/nickel transport system ATP-binding protein
VRCFAREISAADALDEGAIDDRALEHRALDRAVDATAIGPAAERPRDTSGEFAARRVKPLLEVADLKVHFPIRKGLFKRTVGYVRAVDGVSLSIPAGRTLALVGESGCGKTTVGKAILRLIEPTAGRVVFGGDDLATLSPARMRARRRELQIVFQDPYASLDPRMRVSDLLAEGMESLDVLGSDEARRQRIVELLDRVGLPANAGRRYPHEFSGGQRQRIAIARALAVDPKLIVCDEPTSALDVSVQAQILNLLADLQRDLGLTYLFITHNLAVVEYLAHEVAVMYLGRIVERGPVDAVLDDPRHPYTRSLLSAVLEVTPARKRRIPLAGELPSPSSPPAGCHFHPRCPEARPECSRAYPEAIEVAPGHEVRCVLWRKSGAIASSGTETAA